MPFVEGLGEAERVLGGKTKASVGLALKAGQIEQQRRHLRGRLALFCDDPRLVKALRADGLGPLRRPEPLSLDVGIFAFFGPLEVLVEPAPGIFARLGGKRGVDFPVIL